MVKLKQCFIFLALGLASATLIDAAAIGGTAGGKGIDDDPNPDARKQPHPQGAIYVRNKQGLRPVVEEMVDVQMDVLFSLQGYCKGHHCKERACDLGTPGCHRYSKHDQRELKKQMEELMFKMSSTGRCHRTQRNEQWCNEYNYCDVFERDGKGGCRMLEKDELQELLPLLHAQEDGSFDFRVSDSSPYTIQLDAIASSKYSHSSGADEHRGTTASMSKRSLGMVESLFTRDGLSDHGVGRGHDGAHSRLNMNRNRNLSDGKVAQDGSVYVATKSELRPLVHDFSEKGLQVYFSRFGRCHSDKHKTCKHFTCHLGTPGCVAFTSNEKTEILQQYEQLMFKIFSTGTCKRTHKNHKWCNKLGFCDSFEREKYGDCQELQPERYSAVVPVLHPQPDGTYDFHKREFKSPYKIQLEQLYTDRRASWVAGEKEERRAAALTKRSLGSIASLLPRDELARIQIGGDEPQSGLDQQDSPLIDLAIRFHAKATRIRKAAEAEAPYVGLGLETATLTEPKYLVETDRFKSELIASAKEYVGHCDQDSRTCTLNYCYLGPKDCSPLTNTQVSELSSDLTALNAEANIIGKCTESAEVPCDHRGYCFHKGDPNDDRGCRELSKREAAHFLHLVKSRTPSGWFAVEGIDFDSMRFTHGEDNDASSLGGSAGAKQKRDALYFPLDRIQKLDTKDSDPNSFLKFHPLSFYRKDIRALAEEVAEQALKETKSIEGTCEESSKTCNHDDVCQLGTKDCRPFNAQELSYIKKQWTIVVAKGLIMGKCNKIADESENANCDTQGYCYLLLNGNSGAHNPVCRYLTNEEKDKLFNELGDKRQRQLKEYDDFHPSESASSGAGTKAKRSIASTLGSFSAAMQKRDAPEYPLDLMQMEYGENINDHNTCLKLEDPDWYPGWAHKKGQEMSQAVLEEIVKSGYCKEGSKLCHGHSCVLGSPDCVKLTEQDKEDLKAMFEIVFRKMLMMGVCTDPHAPGAKCYDDNYCYKYKNGNGDERDPNCRDLEAEEMKKLYITLEKLRAKQMDEAEAAAKAKASNSGWAAPKAKRSLSFNGAIAPAMTTLEGALQKRAVSSDSANGGGSNDDDFLDLGEISLYQKWAQKQAAEGTEIYMSENIRGYGWCDGCDKPCKAGTAGCHDLGADELAYMQSYYTLLTARMIIMGKCKPGAAEKGTKCFDQNSCFLFINKYSVQRDYECEFMDPEESANLMYHIDQRLQAFKPPQAFKPQASSPGRKSGPKEKRDVPASSAGESGTDFMELQDPGKYPESIIDKATKYSEGLISQFAATVGTCQGESEHCSKGACKVGDAGCQPMTRFEVWNVARLVALAVAEGVVVGKCKPGTQCDESGYCFLKSDKYGFKGERDPNCRELTDGEYSEYILKLLSWRSPESSGFGVGAGSLGSLAGAKQKRHTSEESDNNELYNLPPLKRYPKWIRRMVEPAAKNILDALYETHGVCDDCGNDGFCTWGSTPACRRMFPDEEEGFLESQRRLFAKAAIMGKCDPEAQNAKCMYGYCYLLSHKYSGEPNEYCRPMMPKEHWQLVDTLADYADKHPPADMDFSSDAKVKRDVSDDDNARFNSDSLHPRTTTYHPYDEPEADLKPTEEELKEFKELCSHLAEDSESLQAVAEAVGMEDEEQISELRERFRSLAQDDYLATLALEHAKEAQMLAESKYGPLTDPQNMGGFAGDKDAASPDAETEAPSKPSFAEDLTDKKRLPYGNDMLMAQSKQQLHNDPQSKENVGGGKNDENLPTDPKSKEKAPKDKDNDEDLPNGKD